MAVQVNVDWLSCEHDECIGIRLDAGDKCFAHAGDDERDAALKQVAQTGKIDARGVPLSNTFLKKILDSTPRNLVGHAMPTEVQFRGTTFQDDADFSGVTFQGAADFSGATFRNADFSGATLHDADFTSVTFQDDADFTWAALHGSAKFNAATFQGNADFSGATLHDARFAGAIFQDDADFSGLTFQGYPTFYRATFQDHAAFASATFHNADFTSATFQGDAEFDLATFQGNAKFSAVTFQGNATFSAVTFQGSARFDGVTFQRAQQFGLLLAYRGLNLDGAQFALPVRIEAITISMCCRRARFPGGVQFRLRWADVVLDDTDIPAPSLLTGIPRLASEKLAYKKLVLAEQQITGAWEKKHASHVSEQPRLLSLQRANVAGLGLANVDLTDCRFSGAHNLDKLRLEADVAFKFLPAPVGWEQRRVIAEECTWRASQPLSGRWADPWWPGRADPDDPWWPEGLEEPKALAPGAIADLYRALRKSREDAKDEPGAADFYYGEMEMRRHAHGRADREDGSSRGRVDRSVLRAYWLVSGYGLRAWRAFAWLVGITLAFALAFHMVGFTHPPQPATYWTSLLYAFRSTISLTDNEATLTAWGQLLQALLRLTGPVLLGLALLALRNRVKR